MEKELSEMTLEELWALFPIFLVAPNEKWPEQYDAIAASLRKALNGHPIDRISHIGSTAIQGIWAKDIVDVLIEIPANADMEGTARALERAGFCRMATAAQRVSLNKGYTKKGFADEVYHVHLRYSGDNDELYFRDYLNAHPTIAKEYESLKLALWKRHEHDRDAYTAAKTDFVRRWTAEARKEFGEKY